jgi:antitoxin component of RelBE/YafQ-DinJ toxin-antitoxin module
MLTSELKIERERIMEKRTARLTILIDPRKKQIFEEICAANDLTPSQVVRRLVRQYIIDNAGNRELPEWLKPAGKSAD